MKKRNLLSGFALAVLMTLGISGVAHATNYDCNDQVNNPIPTTYSGDVNVYNAAGTNCSIGHAITATGSISISVHGTLSVQALTSGDLLNVNSAGALTSGGDFESTGSYVAVGTTTGDINIQKVKSDVDTVTIFGGGKVQTQDLTAFNYLTVLADGTTGDVIITGNVNGHYARTDIESAGGSITISGTSSNVNAGQIFQAAKAVTIASITNDHGDVRVFGHTDGVGTTPLNIGSGGVSSISIDGGFGIYLSSPTGINYNGNNLLQTNTTSGPQGYIYFDGGSTGKVTIAGTVSVDRTAGAGSIAIFSPEIIANGATLNASADPGSQAGYINLITAKVTNSGGLTINNNGDGGFAADIHLGITPVGSWGIAYPPTNIEVPVQTIPFAPSSNPLAISGSGTATGAALTVTANGDNRAIQIYGYPLTITSTTGNITQKGTGDAIYVNSTDYVNNIDGVLTLGGNIEIHGNTTSSAGDPNVFGIRGTSLATLSGHVLLDASGITGGAGSDILLPFDSGTLPLGGTGNTVELKSNGAGGKGGNITAGWGGTLAVSINSGSAATASALSGNADGGTIAITANSLTTASGGTLTANGAGTGLSGTVSVTEWDASQAVTLSGLTISATGLGDGSTTNIQIHAAGDLSLDSSSSLDASSTGNHGGQILVSFGENQANSTLTWNGSAKANAASTLGGIITGTSPTGGNIVTNASFDASLTGIGAGGFLVLTTGNLDQANTISMPSGSIDMSATGSGSTNGSINFTAGSPTGATVVVSVSELLGAVHAYGADVSITTSQLVGDMEVQNVAAYNGSVLIAATFTKLKVVKSELAMASIQATADVTLRGDGIDVAIGTGTDEDFISAGGDAPGNINLIATLGSNEDINLGSNLMADGLIKILSFGSGNVVNQGGKILPLTDGATNTLQINAQNGSIGSSTAFILTNVKSLSFSTQSSSSGGVYINNDTGDTDDTLTITSGAAGDKIDVKTTGLLSAAQVVSTSNDVSLHGGNGINITSSSLGIRGFNIALDTDSLSDADITLDADVVSTNFAGLPTISLKAYGNGSIIQTSGTIGNMSSAVAFLTMQTEAGTIGTPANALNTGVGAVQLTNTDASSGSINVNNDAGLIDDLIVFASTSPGSVKIENSTGLDLYSVSSVQGGDIKLIADTQALTVEAGATISAASGRVDLNAKDTGTSGGPTVPGASTITLRAGSQVLATTGVSIYRGTSATAQSPDPTNQPVAVIVDITGGGNVYWSNTSIITNSAGSINQVDAHGINVVFFPAGSADDLRLDGGNVIGNP